MHLKNSGEMLMQSQNPQWYVITKEEPLRGMVKHDTQGNVCPGQRGLFEPWVNFRRPMSGRFWP